MEILLVFDWIQTRVIWAVGVHFTTGLQVLALVQVLA